MKWEYKCAVLPAPTKTIPRGVDDPTNVDEFLNEFGADGWELVCVEFFSPGTHTQLAYMKRPLE